VRTDSPDGGSSGGSSGGGSSGGGSSGGGSGGGGSDLSDVKAACHLANGIASVSRQQIDTTTRNLKELRELYPTDVPFTVEIADAGQGVA